MGVQVVVSPQGIVTAEIDGKLTSSELQDMQQKVGEYIQAHGKARILVLAQRFQGFDRGKWGDTAFQMQFDKQIEKIAVVGEQQWEDLVLMFMGKGLRKVGIEYFKPDELAKARLWVAAV